MKALLGIALICLSTLVEAHGPNLTVEEYHRGHAISMSWVSAQAGRPCGYSILDEPEKYMADNLKWSEYWVEAMMRERASRTESLDIELIDFYAAQADYPYSTHLICSEPTSDVDPDVENKIYIDTLAVWAWNLADSMVAENGN